MAILSKGTTYSDGDQVTSTNLNALVDSATFVSGAVDDSTTQLSSGAIIVKDLGIAAGKIATNAVTTVKILDSNVTKAKIENVANMKALGNVSGSAAAPAEVAILDEDNMASNSATSLATQQSIKAYTDSKVDGTGAGSFTTLAASGVVSVADGSESAPAITNTGDTNTGIYFPDENSVALTAGAGARLTCSTSAITIDKPTTVVSAAQCELTLQGGDANSKNLIFKKASAQQGKIAAVGDELKFYAGTSGTESLEITTTGVVVPGTISVTGLIKQSGDTGFLDIQGGDTAGANIELYGASHASHANDAFYDADSHFFRPANGSSNRVVISSSGLTASGDLTVDTSTLKVDSTNNRVGIGTASPSEELEVSATGVGLLVRNSDANQEAGIATVRGQRSDTNTSPASAGGISLESWNTSGATIVNEHLGSVYFGANHTSGSESNILGTASIAGIAEGTFSNSSTMPSAIAFRTGSAGQAIGVYNHHVGEVERMRIDSSGKVGIGTATPQGPLHIVDGTATGQTASSNAHGIILDSTTNPMGMSFLAANTAKSGILFGDTDDADIGRIEYDHAGNNMNFITNTALQCVVDSAGDWDFQGNNLTNAGTTTTKVLHVTSPNSDTAETIASFGNGDITDGLQIKTNGNGGSSLDWGFNAKNSRNLVFETNQTEHMRIDSSGNVGIGEIVPSAPLTVTSTTGGVLLPRMTTTQMNNDIVSPANGEMIYNTTANKFYGYASGAWVALH